MASTIKLNNDSKVLATVINYNRKCDNTIWSANMMSSFTIVICLQWRPLSGGFCRVGSEEQFYKTFLAEIS